MLAEKFFLLMEMLRSHTQPDGSPRVLTTSPHVPISLPSAACLGIGGLPRRGGKNGLDSNSRP
jgi:hypothetical protein